MNSDIKRNEDSVVLSHNLDHQLNITEVRYFVQSSEISNHHETYEGVLEVKREIIWNELHEDLFAQVDGNEF